MSDSSVLKSSKKIAKLSFEGECHFNESDDAQVGKLLLEKTFYPSISDAHHIAICAAQGYLTKFSPGDMNLFMLANSMREFRSRDSVSVDQIAFDDCQYKSPKDVPVCNVKNLIMSSPSRMAISLSLALNVNQLAETQCGLATMIQTIQDILRKSIAWLQKYLRVSDVRQVREILSSTVHQVLETAEICNSQRGCEVKFFDKPVECNEGFKKYDGVKQQQYQVSEQNCSLLAELQIYKDAVFNGSDNDVNAGLKEAFLDGKQLIAQKVQRAQQEKDTMLTSFGTTSALENSWTQEVPLTMWSAGPKDRQILLDRTLNSSTYLRERLVCDERVHQEYYQENYRTYEVETALENLFSSEVQSKIVSGFYTNQFRVVIIGPQHIANVLARSLAVLLPPGRRTQILYAQNLQKHECAYSISDENEAKLKLPITDRQIAVSKGALNCPVGQRQSVFSAKQLPTVIKQQPIESKHISFMNQVRCRCGRYRHMPVLASGACIQSLCGNVESFHILDYYSMLSQPVVVVDLCNKKFPVNDLGYSNFGFLSNQILKCKMERNEVFLNGLLRGMRHQYRQIPLPLGDGHLVAKYIFNQTLYAAEIALGNALRHFQPEDELDVGVVRLWPQKPNGQKTNSPYEDQKEDPLKPAGILVYSNLRGKISFDRLKTGAVAVSCVALKRAERSSYHGFLQRALRKAAVFEQKEDKMNEIIYKAVSSFLVSGLGAGEDE